MTRDDFLAECRPIVMGEANRRMRTAFARGVLMDDLVQSGWEAVLVAWAKGIDESKEPKQRGQYAKQAIAWAMNRTTFRGVVTTCAVPEGEERSGWRRAGVMGSIDEPIEVDGWETPKVEAIGDDVDHEAEAERRAERTRIVALLVSSCADDVDRVIAVGRVLREEPIPLDEVAARMGISRWMAGKREERLLARVRAAA